MDVYTLPELPYVYDALEPHYSKQHLELHHDKHHATYVKQANATLDQLRDLRAAGGGDPIQLRGLERALAFNVSGHLLHSLFWESMAPEASREPTGDLAAAITEQFGGFEQLRTQMNEAVTSLQGSGWSALVYEPLAGRLVVQQVYDHQDNVTPGNLPLLVIDGWEHAYYLQFQNDKAAWLKAFWNVVDFGATAQRFERARNAQAFDLVGAH